MSITLMHRSEDFGMTRCGKRWVQHPGGPKPVKKSQWSWRGVTCTKCLKAGLISCGRNLQGPR